MSMQRLQQEFSATFQLAEVRSQEKENKTTQTKKKSRNCKIRPQQVSMVRPACPYAGYAVRQSITVPSVFEKPLSVYGLSGQPGISQWPPWEGMGNS